MKSWYPFKLGSGDGNVFLQGFSLTHYVHRGHPDGDECAVIAMPGAQLAW